MNKSEFLRVLSRLLQVLQEEEVRDILEEYEQHINMKIAEGKSEQEATADFGNIEELAAEILSAYHVKADFQEKDKEEKKSSGILHKVQDNSKKAMSSAGDAVKTAGSSVKSVGHRISGFFKKGFRKIADAVKSPFLWLKNKMQREKKVVMAAEKEKKNPGRAFLGMIKRMFDWLIRLCYGCLFLCFGAVEIALLFSGGMLLVLLVMGYPVIGITLIVTGLAMALFTVTVVCRMRMRRNAS